MPITQITPPAEVENYLIDRINRLEEVIIRRMFYIGEKCVTVARSTDSYQDQTGNLRSSIGYVIAKDGKIIGNSAFEAVKGGAEGAAGGLEFAKSVVSKFPEGIVLIVVAGMSYAKHVSYLGYDVLDSSQLEAEAQVNRMIKQLGLK